MKKIILCPNPNRDRGMETTRRADAILRQMGFQTVVCPPFKDQKDGAYGDYKTRPLTAELKSADLLITFGGDGTILRTARQVGFHGTPILGINYGRLGFLANPNEAGVMEPLVAALSGDAAHEVRTNLDIRVVCEGEADPYADDGAGAEPDEPREFFALNEVAVTRGANGRIIDFGLGVSGSHLANMRGGGLVVASATGSTAYALSAGGPLVAPGFTGLVAVPIAPHTLHSRAVVTAPSDVVEMDLSENQDDRDATLFIDGELVELDRPLRRLYVRRGDVPTTLLRYKDEGFYNHAAKVFF